MPETESVFHHSHDILDERSERRYQAVLNLIQEIQKRRFISEVANVVAKHWSACASLSSWRLLCVYEQHCVVVASDNSEVEVTETSLSTLQTYDGKLWQQGMGYELDHEALINQRAALPPELQHERGQRLYVVPIQHGYTTIAVLSALSLDTNFDDFDRKCLHLIADVMATRIVAILAEQILIRERNNLIVQMGQQAVTDALTGITNRRGGESALSQELMRSRRYSEPLSVMLFDIDHLKRVNDGYGNAVGDAVLCAVCTTAQKLLRNTDILARWAGAEFLAILPHTDLAQAMQTAERLRKSIAENGDIPLAVTVSLGVASFTEADTPHHVLERADHAMGRAKQEGRNRCCAEKNEVADAGEAVAKLANSVYGLDKPI